MREKETEFELKTKADGADRWDQVGNDSGFNWTMARARVRQVSGEASNRNGPAQAELGRGKESD